MDNKAKEILAVNEVKNSIVVCDLLDQFISDNDKEPSWDGAVYIYDNPNKRKDALIGRMPVQVKGTENNGIDKEEISFQVAVSDLNNYLTDGGAVFFVVYIAFGGTAKQIYYSELTPIKLRIILKGCDGQKNKNIHLKKFPNDNQKKQLIFLNCFNHCKQQSSFYNRELLTIEELKQQGLLESINIPVSTIKGVDPRDALVKSEIYFYAKIKGSDVLLPIEELPKNITTEEYVDIKISIKDRVFYDKVRFSKTAKDEIITIGHSLKIIESCNGSLKLEYKNSSSMRTLAHDLDFMLAFIENKSFDIDGIEFKHDWKTDETTNFDVEKQKQILETAKNAVRVLDILKCSKDIDTTLLDNESNKNLHYLITGLVENQVLENLKPDLPELIVLGVAGLKLLVYFYGVEEGKYRLLDFFSNDFAIANQNENGEMLPVSQYAALNAHDIANIDNIQLDVLLPSFKKVEYHSETVTYANTFMLELITAFDLCGNKEILNTAKQFAEWILELESNTLPTEFKMLNLLQIKKRLDEMNEDDKAYLYELIEESSENEQILVAGYLLLDNQKMAKKHFDKLTPEEKEAFKTYPIYQFFKNAESV